MNKRDFSARLALVTPDVPDVIGNEIQALISIRYANIFRLPPINPTSQGPSPIRISTIIHISMPAVR